MKDTTRQELEQPIRILIADGHALFRNGLQQLFHSYADLVVVGQAAMGLEAVRVAEQMKPDILLLDFLIDRDVLHIIRQIAVGFGVRTIVLAAKINRDEFIDALRLGASDVILKESSLQRLLASIRSVHAGETPALRSTSETADPVWRFRNKPPKVTERESQVLDEILGGRRNKEIAVRLAITEQTVKHHLSNIFAKFGVSSRLELLLHFRQKKFVADSTFLHRHTALTNRLWQ